MSKEEEGGAIYPEGVVSPREKLDYLKAVYGIDKPNLFDAVIKELMVSFGAQCMVEVEKESGLGAIRIYELYFNEKF